eukprot:6074881-Alexandrium_andersonii.AAC.1
MKKSKSLPGAASLSSDLSWAARRRGECSELSRTILFATTSRQLPEESGESGSPGGGSRTHQNLDVPIITGLKQHRKATGQNALPREPELHEDEGHASWGHSPKAKRLALVRTCE